MFDFLAWKWLKWWIGYQNNWLLTNWFNFIFATPISSYLKKYSKFPLCHTTQGRSYAMTEYFAHAGQKSLTGHWNEGFQGSAAWFQSSVQSKIKRWKSERHELGKEFKNLTKTYSADNSSFSNSNEPNLLNGAFHWWYVWVYVCWVLWMVEFV